MTGNGKYLFLLSGNLSTTPRALKMILYMGAEKCDIIQVSRAKRWREEDDKIFRLNDLKVRSASLGRDNLTGWMYSQFLHYSARLLSLIFRRSVLLNAYASDRATVLLVFQSRRIGKEYDRIFGHGYGSMYASYNKSKKTRIPFAYDIEDFHPGESVRSRGTTEQQRRRFLMKSILPSASILTAASEPIASFSSELGILKEIYVLLNSFPMHEFSNDPMSEKEKIRFVWFSQKIGFSRGLEVFLEAVKLARKRRMNIEAEMSIDLIGNMDEQFNMKVLSPFRTVCEGMLTVHDLLSQKELHSMLNDYDVGLAIEPGKDMNNQLALSNKLMAYVQSGLYVFGSDTIAQGAFISSNPGTGIISGISPEAMSQRIIEILNKGKEIREGRKERFINGQKFSWENQIQALDYVFK